MICQKGIRTHPSACDNARIQCQARVLYSNLKDFQIKMPANYIQGGGGDNTGKMTSNLDVITGMAALGMLDQMNPAGAKKAAGSDSSSSCTVS